MNCLNIVRLWQCSPVAIRTGATSRAIRAWPRMSSGLVGSSIHHGSNCASSLVRSIAVSTSHTWLASIIRKRSSPISSRISAARATSFAGSPPTFILTWLQPASIAAWQRRRTSSSLNPSQPTDVE